MKFPEITSIVDPLYTCRFWMYHPIMTDLKRNLERKINDLLHFFPMVVILGTRQCGKTSLSKKLRPSWKYYDMEKAEHFDLISRDLSFFFKENHEKIIFDEAQLYPDLFKELRGVIDSDRKKKNRFILTGSSSPELLASVSESLAGRVGIVELATFKSNEVYEAPLSSFYEIFNKRLSRENLIFLKQTRSVITHSKVKEHFLKGGYPDAFMAKKQLLFDEWMENYFRTYINRDIRSLFPKLDQIKFRRFTQILANLSGLVLNKSNVARAIEIDNKTVKDYIDIADGTFVWRTIESYDKNNTLKSIIKMPKGGFRDSGLLNYLKKIQSLEDLDHSPSIGHDFEHYVIEEIIKGLQATSITNWNYYFYRTRGGAEIDLILEGSFGILPIEIKYGVKINKRSLSSLKQFVEKNNLPFGIVINNADEIKLISENIIQIPVTYI